MPLMSAANVSCTSLYAESGVTLGIAWSLLILRPRQFLLKTHNLLNLHQKPPVNSREIENLFDGEAGAQGVADEEDALGVGHAQLAADDVAHLGDTLRGDARG